MGSRNTPPYYGLPGARLHLLEEVGEGFLVGTALGSAFHFIRGLRSSPSGGSRLAGSAWAVRSNVLRFAGSFAAFWGLCCGLEEAMAVARRKEDRWNAIAAFAASSGLVELRRGARTAVRSALGWGTFALLVEGASIVLNNPVFEFEKPEPAPAPAPAPDGGRRHVPEPGNIPRGFLGIPPGPPIVVEELPASDLDGLYGL